MRLLKPVPTQVQLICHVGSRAHAVCTYICATWAVYIPVFLRTRMACASTACACTRRSRYIQTHAGVYVCAHTHTYSLTLAHARAHTHTPDVCEYASTSTLESMHAQTHTCALTPTVRYLLHHLCCMPTQIAWLQPADDNTERLLQ